MFAEDVAALGGLSLALVFIALAVSTSDPRRDAAGSICIGALLVLVAVLVAIEIKGLLIGQSVDPQVLEDARAPAGREEVEAVYNARPAARPRSDGRGQGEDAPGRVGARARRGDQPRRAELSRAFPEVKWLFFEPDVAD